MMKVLCTRAADCESGATAMEYALTAAILSVALLTGAETVGSAIKTQFGQVSGKLAITSVHDAGPGGTSMVSLQSPAEGEASTGTKVSWPRP
jgi:pilus assembly protein Flp/PilA